MNVKLLSVTGLMMALGLSAPALGQNFPPSRNGFPIVINGGGTLYNHPVVADLKWPAPYDQYKSIIFTSWNTSTSEAWLYVVRYDGTNATVAPNFPKPMPTLCAGSPAVGDLDGDGIPEIVVPYGSNFRDLKIGGVRAFLRDGTQLWDYSSSNSAPSCCGANFNYGVVGAPAIGDLDGDGIVEVVWGSFDGKVYVVDGRNGNDKPGWPIFMRDTIWSSPALFDFDGDGKMEIVIGVDAHLEGAPFNTPQGGVLHVLRFDGAGTGFAGMIPVPELPGFPINYDQTLFSAPAIGDIDGDGKPEIVFGTGTYYGNPAPCGSGIPPLRQRRVYAVKCDGSSVSGWPVTTVGEVRTTPALADLDGDGVPDVVVTDIDCSSGNDSGTNHSVYGFKGNGAQLFQTVVRSLTGVSFNAGDPIVADVLGDTKPEILVPTNTELCVISSTGVQLTASSYPAPPGVLSFFMPMTLGNGTVTSLKIDATTSDPVDVITIAANDLASLNTNISVWNPKNGAVPAAPWGMLRQNPARTAFAPGTPGCIAPPAAAKFYVLPPCRLFDTRDPVGPFGGPSLPASGTKTVDLVGRCGVPADAGAVSINVAVVGPSAPGFLVVYPGGQSQPATSTINFSANQTRANNAILRVSTDGNARLVVKNGSAGVVDVIADVNGFFK